jgi:hypothetical protein
MARFDPPFTEVWDPPLDVLQRYSLQRLIAKADQHFSAVTWMGHPGRVDRVWMTELGD